MLWRNVNKWRIRNENNIYFCVLNDNYIYPLTIMKSNNNLSISHSQFMYKSPKYNMAKLLLMY